MRGALAFSERIYRKSENKCSFIELAEINGFLRAGVKNDVEPGGVTIPASFGCNGIVVKSGVGNLKINIYWTR